MSKDGTWRVFNIDGWYMSFPRNEYLNFLNLWGACPRILRLVHNDFSQTYPIVFFDIQPVFVGVLVSPIKLNCIIEML